LICIYFNIPAASVDRHGHWTVEVSLVGNPGLVAADHVPSDVDWPFPLEINPSATVVHCLYGW